MAIASVYHTENAGSIPATRYIKNRERVSDWLCLLSSYSFCQNSSFGRAAHL